MSKVTLIKGENIQFNHRGGPPGMAQVGRAVSTEMSSSMGAGIAHFDACSVAWTVLYDEVVYVIDGVFRLQTNAGPVEGKAGDVLWIPNGTELCYEGEKASIFYAVYPGNWKELLAEK
ncbi:cupin domain-containing protein [Marinomonas sp. 15G1-11]|uniref:Cupin domain-containing protein n=1 Tax=Marinomonas phaeophyticola TaxID=3004091 RepID=A0ABT4JW76_9GAMM|nr:cupin domain-containing protein [Marinomonas sp. 15G1-11]MCZ2722633.1 cupin domain-containing protein [Marinomonas sp. 15G1-11]